MRWCAVDETHTAPPNPALRVPTDARSVTHAPFTTHARLFLGRCDYWAEEAAYTTHRRTLATGILIRQRLTSPPALCPSRRFTKQQSFKLGAQKGELDALRASSPQRCCQVKNAAPTAATEAIPALCRIGINMQAGTSVIVQRAVDLARPSRSFACKPIDVIFRVDGKQRIATRRDRTCHAMPGLRRQWVGRKHTQELVQRVAPTGRMHLKLHRDGRRVLVVKRVRESQDRRGARHHAAIGAELDSEPSVGALNAGKRLGV